MTDLGLKVKKFEKKDGGASVVSCEPFSKNWSVDFIGFRGDDKRTQKFESIFCLPI
jgi:hypothetical protein